MIKIQTTPESIESKGGLILAGKIAKIAGLRSIISKTIKEKAGIILTSLFALMVEGKSDFESLGEKRYNQFFKDALEIPYVYAKETARLYLEEMAAVDADEIIIQLRESSTKIIKQGPLHGFWIGSKYYIPVDIDTSVMDNSKTKKEGVSWTYRGFDGYHPIFAYVGIEGYMLDCELRPGSQHCQNGTVDFIKSLIERLNKMNFGRNYLFRLDSGNDASETLQIIMEAGEGYNFIIKRNKRRENDEKWLKRAKRNGKPVESRDGKKVWIGKTKIKPHKKGDIYCVYEVTERKSDSAGNQLLIPEIEVNSFWTNLSCEAEEVIKQYHAHATSEQYHSELKHDMGIERLASGKFAVNQILLALAMNAYNALRFLGQKAIEKNNGKMERRKRLGKVIRDIICVAGKFVKHARELIFKINENDPILPVFLRLNAALDSL